MYKMFKSKYVHVITVLFITTNTSPRMLMLICQVIDIILSYFSKIKVECFICPHILKRQTAA